MMHYTVLHFELVRVVKISSSRCISVLYKIREMVKVVFILVVHFAEEWYPQGKQNILPGQMTETLVTNLRPWTVYHLRVFAENQLGKSKDGKVLQVPK
jgi:hypothetical protein